jgi:rhamnogalacturonan endolyase
VINRKPKPPVHARCSSASVERLESRCLLSTSLAASAVTTASALPARQAEYLDRGLVALYKGLVTVNSQQYATNYISWRLLGTDPGSIAFNIYRSTAGAAAVKLNSLPITATTDYTDYGVDTTKSNAYYVKPVIGGVEQAASNTYTLPANAPARQYIPIPLSAPPIVALPDGSTYTYNANDASVGDVDGDGQYEIILKWDPSNSKDNSQSGYTGNVYFDCYKLNGTRLWRISMGRNIRAGAHYSPFLVYDFDGDGKSEFVVRTAPGTVDALGHDVILPGDDPNADYRNSGGYVLTGPEYLTVFNGSTGAAMATVPFYPDRVDVTQWGDNYGNRVDRFLATVAYLDGVHPSIVMCRGYYGPRAPYPARNEIAAYDWAGGNLSQRWIFKAAVGINGDINSDYVGQGAHSLSVGDVDGDGKDEIIYGGAAIDDNGAPLWNSHLGHGDAIMMSDMDPSHPGEEIFQVHEDTGSNGHIGGSLRDAATGTVLQGLTVTQNADGTWPDVGRGNAFDIDPNYPGFEMWDSAHGYIYNVNGTQIQSKGNVFQNFGVWWDGDLLRELLDGTTIADWKITNGVGGRSNLVSSTSSGINSSAGLSSNNSTKSTPCLVADIFGDWREEVIWRKSDNTELQIWSTATASSARIYTLMHDIQYRESVSLQNSGYNQPTQTSFFLGAGMSTPPTPNIYFANLDTVPPTASGQFNYDQVQSVVVQFSEPMKASTVYRTDLVLHPTSYIGADRLPYAYVYNSTNNTAAFYFQGILPDGNYIATIAAGSVSDAAGNSLAADYSFSLFTLGGDANRDRVVDINDLAILAMNWKGADRIFSQGDFNYDGNVDAKDLGILSLNWQRNLPADPPPAPPTSIFKTVPRRTPRVISLL